jgi:glycosyltransferase involved in cell wall biosynthesis
VNVFLWHVHGSWMTAFVQGRHRYLVPVDGERSEWGRGRARTWNWPASVTEVSAAEAALAEIDVVVLQRPEELNGLAAYWLGGRAPGRHLPAVYVEHNAPQGRINEMVHPAAGRSGITVAHVTRFNDLFWDCGPNRTVVVEHGVVDPGHRYRGDRARLAVVINEADRRGRVTGTDLLPRFAAAAPVDLFGMGNHHRPPATGVHTTGDLVQDALHTEMARRRVYLHPIRWTSLGLSLLEAMHLGMPVVALATTEVAAAVPGDAGVVSTDVDVLVDAARRLVADPEEASVMGKAARAAALARYGLDRFLDDWDRLLEEVRR